MCAAFVEMVEGGRSIPNCVDGEFYLLILTEFFVGFVSVWKVS